MTINKAQSQTLDRIGLYLNPPVFAHGQLYVGMSRAKQRANMMVCLKKILHLLKNINFQNFNYYKKNIIIKLKNQT